MALTIMPLPFSPDQVLAGDLLQLSGDIDQRMVIPVPAPQVIEGETWTECYYIGLSDGSLIRASNDVEQPDFVIEVAGPAGAVIDGTGRILSIPGKVDWVTLAPNRGAHAVADHVWMSEAA